MDDLYIELEIDKIPVELTKIFKRRDGTDGVSIKLRCKKMRYPDSFGNTHTLFIRQSKEDLKNGAETIFVGKAKHVEEFKNESNGYYGYGSNTGNNSSQAINDDEPPF